MTDLVHWLVSTPERQWYEASGMISAADRSLTDDAEATLTLSRTRHQQHLGFGGCFNESGWQALSVLDANERDEIFQALFHPTHGCRFTHCRVPIGANDYALEWYSHNETPDDYAMEHFSLVRDQHYLLPYIHAAQSFQPALTLFASPWSPPTWMKTPQAYNFGTLRWDQRVLTAYALYLLRFAQGYLEAGCPVRQLHVQNEPISDQKFPSCVWSGEQMRDFIRDYLGPLFAHMLPETEIWLGTINSDDYDLYANTVLSDPQARRYIAGVGYQWAGKHAIERTASSWSRIRLMQTETECGDGTNSWEYARYTFSLIQHYLSHGAESYCAWNMVLPPGGMSTWGWKQNALITIHPETHSITYNPEFYIMQHVAHWIEAGAVRLGLQGQWTANALAYENPDGKRIIVVQNPFAEARSLVWQDTISSTTFQLEPHSLNTLVFASER